MAYKKMNNDEVLNMFLKSVSPQPETLSIEQCRPIAESSINLFNAHIEAGFTQKQALQIVIGILTGGMKS